MCICKKVQMQSFLWKHFNNYLVHWKLLLNEYNNYIENGHLHGFFYNTTLSYYVNYSNKQYSCNFVVSKSLKLIYCINAANSVTQHKCICWLRTYSSWNLSWPSAAISDRAKAEWNIYIPQSKQLATYFGIHNVVKGTYNSGCETRPFSLLTVATPLLKAKEIIVFLVGPNN